MVGGRKGSALSLKLQSERHLAKDETEDTGILGSAASSCFSLHG